MRRFEGVKEQVSNISRGAWMVIGLIVVAGVIGALFVYGEPNDQDVADTGNGEVVEENGENGENGDSGETAEDTEADTNDETGEDSGGSAATNSGEDGSNGNGEVPRAGVAGEDGEELPSELADTGAALPLAGAFLLGSSGYYYFRSRTRTKDLQR